MHRSHFRMLKHLDLAGKVCLCEIDELFRTTVENRLHREHSKMIGLIQGRLGRHGKLLSGAHDVDQRWPLVRESGLDRASQLLRLLDSESFNAHSLCHKREVWIFEVTTRIQETTGLHLQFDKTE